MKTSTAPIRYRLATEADNDALLALVGKTMPGAVQLSYDYAPSYFNAVALAGETTQTLVGERNGRIVGKGLIAKYTCYVAKRVVKAAYLGGLSVAQDAERTMNRNIIRAYQQLRKYLCDVEVMFTTIVTENHRARRLLEANLPLMPKYLHLDTFATCVLKPRSFRSEAGTETKWEDVLAFIQDQGQHRNGFPAVHSASELRTYCDEIISLRDGGIMKGIIGLTNHQQRKNIRIDAYSRSAGVFKTIWNHSLAYAGYPKFPSIGNLDVIYASLLLAQDPEVAHQLIRAALNKAQNHDLLMIGVTQSDSLYKTVKQLKPYIYRSELYQVSYGSPVDLQGPIHLEVARL